MCFVNSFSSFYVSSSLWVWFLTVLLIPHYIYIYIYGLSIYIYIYIYIWACNKHAHTHMLSYTCKRKKMKVLVNSLTQESNPGLLHCRWILYHLNHEGSPHRHTYRVNGYPLQYSCWGNLVDRGGWRTTVHGVAKGWTWLKELSTYAYVGACVCIYVCVCIYIYIYLHLYSMFSCEIQMHKSSYLWKDHRERYKITHSKGLIS